MPSFVTVAESSEIPPGQIKEVELEGQSILVVNVNGQFFAIDSICTHRGGPLAEGELRGEIVTCPWHRGGFDVRTGEAVALPTTEPVTTYRVRMVGTSVQVAPD
jgi:nitrite reductase/ring-hydroxylating ferredoxin subunit